MAAAPLRGSKGNDRQATTDDASSDEALARLALHDRRAFAPLYARYANRLYRYALAHTASPQAAEDVVADTMVAALEGLERFDAERGSFGGWLFGIAARTLSARNRRNGRFQRLLTRAWEPEPLEDDPLSTIVRTADAQRLRELLRELPDKDREMVLLRYGADLNSSEIAEALGMKSSAVRVRLMRVLQRLGTELGDDR